MYKKPYYRKKRTYYKKKKYYNKSENNEIDPIALGIILLILFSFMTYKFFIEPNLEFIISFLKVFIPFIIISWITIYYYIYKKNKEIRLENIKNTPEFLLNLEKDIKWFKPLDKWFKEDHFRDWLTGFLSWKYNSVDIEETREYVRPDIVINNTIIWDIAIEIKWPTNMQWLTSLPDKINKYLPRWNYLYIVLFEIDIVKYKNTEDNIQIYNQKKDEILKNISEDKKDKVIFIEMWFKRK